MNGGGSISVVASVVGLCYGDNHRLSEAFAQAAGVTKKPDLFVLEGQNRDPSRVRPKLMGMDNRLPLAVPGAEAEFERIEVRRSARRRKTISAEVRGSTLVVSLPERLSRAEEERWVADLARRLAERRRRDRLNGSGELKARADELADRYLGGVRAARAEWIQTQKTRWGYCIPAEGAIFVSAALAEFPTWVRDYVLVHELAHLQVPDHSPAFWELVARYPRTERAIGYLMAKGIEEG
jgi:predicted metal-dependent hydrolase